jgi:hypothetical protein
MTFKDGILLVYSLVCGYFEIILSDPCVKPTSDFAPCQVINNPFDRDTVEAVYRYTLTDRDFYQTGNTKHVRQSME